MKRTKQHSLLTSVLVSELLYLNNKEKKESVYLSKKLKTAKGTYVLLDTFKFLQNLKQVVRLMQFQYKQENYNTQIILSNIFLRQILFHIIKKYKNTNTKFVINNTLNYNLKTNTAIYLDNVAVKHTALQKAFNNKINALLYVGTQLNKNVFGNYKIHTNINNFKKIIFLSIVLLLSQQSISK